MRSTEFINEGVDRNIADVKENHPDVYALLSKILGSTTLEKSTVSSFDAAGAHQVLVQIKPSAGLINAEAGFYSAGIEYEIKIGPASQGGLKLLSGSNGDMSWTVKDSGRIGNFTQTWQFSIAKTNTNEELVSAQSVFASNASNILGQEGITFYEKPSYWSDLERKALSNDALRTAEFALEEEGIELKEYDAFEIFAINPNRKSSYVRGPLQSVENMPQEKVFVIHNLPYSDEEPSVTSDPKVGTFLVDAHGAHSYIRSWILIK